MKKAMVTAIAIAGIFIFFIIGMCPAMSGPTISVEPSYLKVSQGDTFTINITVNPDGVEIGGAQYELYFNSLLLNAIEQTKSPFLSQDGASTMEVTNTINNTIGKTEYGEIRMGDPNVIGGVTTPSVLATITFEAMDPGMCSLSLDNVILSDPFGYQISGILINNGTCVIGTTPTPTPTPTPTSGGGDSGNGGTPITPTPTQGSTPTPTSISSPTETPGLTPTLTPTINPVPSLSPSSSSTISTSPTPTASMPMSEENNRLPGFEAAFAIVGLLVVSYSLLKGKRGVDK